MYSVGGMFFENVYTCIETEIIKSKMRVNRFEWQV